MKLFSIRHSLWLGLLCASAPVVMAGCGGGSNPVRVPAIPAIPVSVPQFALQNGQLATLRFEIRGTAINGTIAIVDGAQTDSSRRIPPGTYPFAGTFTPPRGYEVGGTFGTAGAFTVRGDFPTTSQTGSYNIGFQGQNISGVLPVLRNPVS